MHSETLKSVLFQACITFMTPVIDLKNRKVSSLEENVDIVAQMDAIMETALRMEQRFVAFVLNTTKRHA